PEQTFFRQLKDQEFDVSEMSLSSYITARNRGDAPFIAIPVFPSRIFRHSCIFVNADAGIRTPGDLAGRRVGVPYYQMTAAVWVRGFLQHDFGLPPEAIHWVAGEAEMPGRLPVAQLASILADPLGPGESLDLMLEAGKIDALVTTYLPSSFRRGSPAVRRLFPDPRPVEEEYFRRTGIFPIMHTVVLRDELHRRHPWVARSLYRAFEESKERALRRLYDINALAVTLPWLVVEIEQTRRLMGEEFWPYGIEPNRRTLETLVQYLVEQKLAERRLPLEELFADNAPD
ncbi:MAG: PhnD/SsuA/transferrin family substrate-binding protein, partial [candidate division NC10 bacterium]